jgi:hypothetical protein
VQPLQDFLTPPPPTPTLPPAAPAAPAADATATPLPDITATPLPTAPGAPVQATPVPAAPGADAATAAGLQTVNLAALAALFIYLGFFGLLGYRRGSRRELIVLLVALGSSFLLQRFSDAIVTLFDRFGKGLAFIAGQPIPDQSGIGAWAAANTQTLLILLWLGIVVTTYILTAKFVRKSGKDGWAVLLGVLNGLIFASIFAPLLTILIFPTATVEGPAVQMPFLGFLGNVWQQISNLVANVWATLQPISTNVIFLGIVLLILLAALTLRTSVKPKS